MEHLFDIQFFADAGSLVNGTTNYPNAYDATASAALRAASSASRARNSGCRA